MPKTDSLTWQMYSHLRKQELGTLARKDVLNKLPAVLGRTNESGVALDLERCMCRVLAHTDHPGADEWAHEAIAQILEVALSHVDWAWILERMLADCPQHRKREAEARRRVEEATKRV